MLSNTYVLSNAGIALSSPINLPHFTAHIIIADTRYFQFNNKNPNLRIIKIVKNIG